MEKKIYIQLIAIPILLIILVVASITMFNINSWYIHKEQTIDKLTQEYIERNKQKINHDVIKFVQDIDYIREKRLKMVKKNIKNKVDNLLAGLESDYKFNKSTKDNEYLKKELINIVKSQNKEQSNHYFFLLDIKSGKALVHNIKSLEGKNLTNKKDIKGTYTFRSKIKILEQKDSSFQTLYFEKPTNHTNEFKKIVYFSKFKPFNWILGTGIYIDEEEEKIKKRIAEKYNAIQTNISNYLFVSKLHNINGGKDFATTVIVPNRVEIIGKNISDETIDTKGKYYKKEYLKLLKSNGEAYMEYWYKKQNSSKEGKKLSYFYHYKPWNWIISSEFYFDDLEKDIKIREELIEEEISNKFKDAIMVALFFIIISIILFFWFAKGITKTIKKYIKKINQQKNTFESLFENSHDGIVLLKEGVIFDCNSTVLEMFNLNSKDEMIGKEPEYFSAPIQKNDKSAKSNLKKYIQEYKGKGSVIFNWKTKKATGEIFDSEITLSRIVLDEGRIVHILIRDISKRVRLEKETKQKDTILIQQSKMASMGEMIGNIAHQWRQPLNALGLTIQKIKMYYDEDMLSSKELEKSVNKSKMLIEKMSSTIDDFRNYFKVDKIKRRFNINESIINTLDLLEATIKHHNIEIKTNDLDKEIYFFGHKNELEQVLLNIINNAKDALLERNVNIPFINIDLIDKNNKIYIKISDNGGGINEDMIDNIFEPYFTTKEQGKGTGIGLYMSKMIIQNNMNGNLFVENTNEGACFTIELIKD